jgi:hypothetical protein
MRGSSEIRFWVFEQPAADDQLEILLRATCYSTTTSLQKVEHHAFR